MGVCKRWKLNQQFKNSVSQLAFDKCDRRDVCFSGKAALMSNTTDHNLSMSMCCCKNFKKSKSLYKEKTIFSNISLLLPEHQPLLSTYADCVLFNSPSVLYWSDHH